jgi:hypothetical protein
MFERFRRGIGAAHRGRGLGLALVRESAGARGEDAWAEPSALGDLDVHTSRPIADRSVPTSPGFRLGAMFERPNSRESWTYAPVITFALHVWRRAPCHVSGGAHELYRAS